MADIDDLLPGNTPVNRPKKLPRSAWKPGFCPNPDGRPPTGQTWGDIFTLVMNMSPEDIARMVGTNNDLGRSLLMLPRRVQMKFLVAARVCAAIMFEPTPGLLNALMERMDGKIPENIQVNGAMSWESFVKGSDDGSTDPGPGAT